MISPQKSYKQKSMTHTDKDKVEVSFNLKTSKNNVMPTFFYSNISEFPEIFQLMLNEGT